MAEFIEMRGNAADAVTGERVPPGTRVLDTGIRNRKGPYMANSRNRVVKEETIVWLAEQAGFKVCRGDCDCKPSKRVSEPAPVVEREDAGVGDGEDKAGEVKAGGGATVKRRSSGTTKGK